MIGHTFLTIEEESVLKKTLQKTKFGDCIQDNFLNRFMNNLPQFSVNSKSVVPRLFYLTNDYNHLGNYRVLEDMNSNQALAYFYFDYPLMKSHLYLGTNFRELQDVFLYVVTKTTNYAHFRTTPLNGDFLTMKIIMGLVNEDPLEKYKSPDSKQTLEYFHFQMTMPKSLFEVIDNEDIPQNIKDLF